MKITVGYLQYKPERGKVERNLEKVNSLLHDVSFDLLVLPELAFSGYFFITPDELMPFADSGFSSKPAKYLRDLSETKNSAIIAGFPEAADGVLYNSQYAFLPDGSAVVYRKSHLFYKEKKVFCKGNTGPVILDFRGVKVGMMVCFDWFFPEFSRILALKGAHILAVSANLVLPGLGQRGMMVRSIENRVFSIVANRTGSETSSEGERIKFTGLSQICTPAGEIVAFSDEDAEEVKTVEIDTADAENKWITPLNNLIEDRREDLYQGLLDD